jgi:carbon-monoxide dehydrogenase small subunit
MMSITVTINGRIHELDVRPDSFLLEVIRDELALTGAKECCLEGECGACTVIIDGRSVDSCLILAAEVDGAEIITVEGLGEDGLSRLQEAFLDSAAVQCGFCIPGQLMAARALLDETTSPTRAEIRQALAGNLCRCAGYDQIADAVADAATVVS